MNYRTLGVIGVRLLALWMIASGLTFLPQFVNAWFWSHLFADQAQTPVAAENLMRLIYTLAIADRLLIGFLLWVFSSRISQRLIPAGNAAALEASSLILVQGAIAIAGLVIAVTAIPTLITRSLMTSTVLSTARPPYAAQGWMLLAMPGIFVLLGLALILGARHLHDLIFRLRTKAA